jgi:uncharacterized damage-inducible protein DinB
MISVEYCQVLARYNRWMNERLYAVVGALSEPERTRDRGAFFGSMHRTLNHILWGDRIWLARFTGDGFAVPAFGADMYSDFEDLTHEREATDTAILDWTGQLTPGWLAGTLEYRSVSDPRLRRLARWVAVAHLFQHATHHRGQLATLVKQAGKETGVTDLPWMPGIVTFVDPGG